MIRLYFYVEGQTEQAYVSRVLRSHLAGFGVMVEGAILVSTGRRHGIVHRGGGRRYAPLRKDLLNLLKQHKSPDVRFTTMFDLYALHSDFPGMEQADKLRHVAVERVQALETALAADIGDDRLLPHVQLHEFETILFCDPNAFATYYPACERQVQTLKEVAAGFQSPEEIDDGEQTAPSKRIARVFPDYVSAKPDAPSVIAEHIELQTVRNKCRHFDAWITTLESLDRPGKPTARNEPEA